MMIQYQRRRAWNHHLTAADTVDDGYGTKASDGGT